LLFPQAQGFTPLASALGVKTMTATKEQLVSGIQAIGSIGSAIQELGQVPAGVMYAQLMGKVSLEQFERMIGILVSANLVTRDTSHMLHWIGPKAEKGAQ
jgi:hypothetical protein